MAPHAPHRSDAPRRSRGAPRRRHRIGETVAVARVPVPEAVEAVPPRALSRWLAATRQFCRARTLGAVGAAVIVVMFAVALLAPVLAPYDPEAVDFAALLAPPSPAHWLGTDSLGRAGRPRVPLRSAPAPTGGFGAPGARGDARAVL